MRGVSAASDTSQVSVLRPSSYMRPPSRYLLVHEYYIPVDRLEVHSLPGVGLLSSHSGVCGQCSYAVRSVKLVISEGRVTATITAGRIRECPDLLRSNVTPWQGIRFPCDQHVIGVLLVQRRFAGSSETCRVGSSRVHWLIGDVELSFGLTRTLLVVCWSSLDTKNHPLQWMPITRINSFSLYSVYDV